MPPCGRCRKPAKVVFRSTTDHPVPRCWDCAPSMAEAIAMGWLDLPGDDPVMTRCDRCGAPLGAGEDHQAHEHGCAPDGGCTCDVTYCPDCCTAVGECSVAVGGPEEDEAIARAEDAYEAYLDRMGA